LRILSYRADNNTLHCITLQYITQHFLYLDNMTIFVFIEPPDRITCLFRFEKSGIWFGGCFEDTLL
jgi:hypothetical protein